MNFFGVMLGAFMLLAIGFGHILIIKGEYHFGTKLWSIFLIIALSSIIASVYVGNELISGILGIIGFTFLWSIHEIFKQKERVKKGWFPKKAQETNIMYNGTSPNTVYTIRYAHPNCSATLRNFAYTEVYSINFGVLKPSKNILITPRYNT